MSLVGQFYIAGDKSLVQEIIRSKTGYIVRNLNDLRANNPITDLKVSSEDDSVLYEVSVKAKDSPEWPQVKGIMKKQQYIVFVDFYERTEPDFYVLTQRQWNNVLLKILPTRKGAEIKDGAIVWIGEKNGKRTTSRASLLRVEEISRYKNNWSALPGVD